jgi:hypothetical protein
LPQLKRASFAGDLGNAGFAVASVHSGVIQAPFESDVAISLPTIFLLELASIRGGHVLARVLERR